MTSKTPAASSESLPTTGETHDGQKYIREIKSAQPGKGLIRVDVYCVLEAYQVTCSATQHAIKKLLCAGQRGKGSVLDDLKGALIAVRRAIELEKDRKEPPPL